MIAYVVFRFDSPDIPFDRKILRGPQIVLTLLRCQLRACSEDAPSWTLVFSKAIVAVAFVSRALTSILSLNSSYGPLMIMTFNSPSWP